MLHYYHAAQIHGTMWQIFSHYNSLDGEPIVDFCARVCHKYLSGVYLTADPVQHLFGECSHGCGHGIQLRWGNSDRCDSAPKGQYTSAQYSTFKWACHAGARHTVANQQKGCDNCM